MRKSINIIFITAFMLVLLIPAITTNNMANVSSGVDNRMLMEFPEFNIDFCNNLNSYVEDRVGYRKEMISFYQNMNVKLFNYLSHPLYEFGKKDWIMCKNWDPEQTFHLNTSEDYVSAFVSFITDIKSESEANQAEFVFLLVPNKETIYPEYLTSGYKINTANETKAEKLVQELKSNNVNHLYLYSDFIEMKNDILLYNKKIDAGHWNQNGKFYGINLLNEYLHDELNVDVNYLYLNDYRINSGLKPHYLNESWIEIMDDVPEYSLNHCNYAESDELYWDNIELLNRNRYHIHLENSNCTNSKVLIFGDSYFGEVSKFFGNQYKEVTLIHASNIGLYKYYIELFKPDIVIMEAVERVVGENSEFYSWDVLNSNNN